MPARVAAGRPVRASRSRFRGSVIPAVALLASTLLMAGCSPVPGHSAASQRATATDRPGRPSVPPAPTGKIGTASLIDGSGRAAGTATFTQDRTDLEITIVPTAAPPGATLRISTAPAATDCSDDEYSLDFGQAADGPKTIPLPRDLMPKSDPTMWRSLLLVAPPAPGASGTCAMTVIASSPIVWTREPAGLSAPIHDSGSTASARGTLGASGSGTTTYTPATGDTPTAVAARLGITLDDLHWLNPMEFHLRAGMPINLDPEVRGLGIS